MAKARRCKKVRLVEGVRVGTKFFRHGKGRSVKICPVGKTYKIVDSHGGLTTLTKMK